MADPLELLREYNISKKEIIEENDEISFGENSFPKTTKTNYRIYGSKKNAASPGEYYTLETLVFFLKYMHLPYDLYKQIGMSENVPLINDLDRKKLTAYLKGECTLSDTVSISRKNRLSKNQHCILNLLREYNMNMKLGEIIVKDDQIIFGEHSFPKAFKVWGKGNPNYFRYYDLECLLTFLKNADMDHYDYAKLSKEKDMFYVRFPDREKLLAYFNGETSDIQICPVTVKDVGPEEQTEQNQDPVAKKPKLE